MRSEDWHASVGIFGSASNKREMVEDSSEDTALGFFIFYDGLWKLFCLDVQILS